MTRIPIAAALAAACLPAMVLETGAAHASQFAQDYQLACHLTGRHVRVVNTTPHTIKQGTPFRITFRLPNRQIVSKVWYPFGTVTPSQDVFRGRGPEGAESCAAAVTLKLNIASKIERRPQLGRPLIEKGPKRI